MMQIKTAHQPAVYENECHAQAFVPRRRISSSTVIIQASHLTKTFRSVRRKDGVVGTLSTLFSRQYDEKIAVHDVSFELEAGELVGYIGPNGAGKSTTIKMLTGILVPTSGECSVNGIVPWADRQNNGRQIGVVFGQRTQLYWDLPLSESFALLRAIYAIPADVYRRNLQEFTDLLALDEFMRTPVRQLSLGQRMRGDFAAAMLHSPKVVFLDEPTIGLDVVAKEAIRGFIARTNSERRTTFILTTHDLNDVEKLCARIIIIDHGQKLYDGSIDAIKQRFGRQRVLTAVIDGYCADCDITIPGVRLVSRQGSRIVFEFDRGLVRADELIVALSQRYELKDVTVMEPELETIIRQIYQKGFGPEPQAVGAAP